MAKQCKELEYLFELFKVDYEKLWVSLIAAFGGLGTLLVKFPHLRSLLVLNFLTILGIIIALIVTHLRILKIIKHLSQCKED